MAIRAGEHHSSLNLSNASTNVLLGIAAAYGIYQALKPAGEAAWKEFLESPLMTKFSKGTQEHYDRVEEHFYNELGELFETDPQLAEVFTYLVDRLNGNEQGSCRSF